MIEKLSERIGENATLSEALKGKTLTYNLVSTIDHLGRQMERALKASQGGGVEAARGGAEEVRGSI